MRMIEQMEKVLRLLEVMKDDLKEWLDSMEEDGYIYDVSIGESRELISKAESLLHEIGA